VDGEVAAAVGRHLASLARAGLAVDGDLTVEAGRHLASPVRAAQADGDPLGSQERAHLASPERDQVAGMAVAAAAAGPLGWLWQQQQLVLWKVG